MEDEGFFLSLLADSPYSTEIFWNTGTRATRSCQQQASCKDSSVWFTYKVTWGMKWTPRNSWKPPERQQRQAGLARVQVWVCTLVVPVAQAPVLFPFKGTVPSTLSWQANSFLLRCELPRMTNFHTQREQQHQCYSAAYWRNTHHPGKHPWARCEHGLNVYSLQPWKEHQLMGAKKVNLTSLRLTGQQLRWPQGFTECYSGKSLSTCYGDYRNRPSFLRIRWKTSILTSCSDLLPNPVLYPGWEENPAQTGYMGGTALGGSRAAVQSICWLTRADAVC